MIRCGLAARIWSINGVERAAQIERDRVQRLADFRQTWEALQALDLLEGRVHREGPVVEAGQQAQRLVGVAVGFWRSAEDGDVAFCLRDKCHWE